MELAMQVDEQVCTNKCILMMDEMEYADLKEKNVRFENDFIFLGN